MFANNVLLGLITMLILLSVANINPATAFRHKAFSLCLFYYQAISSRLTITCVLGREFSPIWKSGKNAIYQNFYYNSETYTAYKTRGFYQNLKNSILMTPYKSLLTQVKNKKSIQATAKRSNWPLLCSAKYYYISTFVLS